MRLEVGVAMQRPVQPRLRAICGCVWRPVCVRVLAAVRSRRLASAPFEDEVVEDGAPLNLGLLLLWGSAPRVLDTFVTIARSAGLLRPWLVAKLLRVGRIVELEEPVRVGHNEHLAGGDALLEAAFAVLAHLLHLRARAVRTEGTTANQQAGNGAARQCAWRQNKV